MAGFSHLTGVEKKGWTVPKRALMMTVLQPVRQAINRDRVFGL